MEFSPQTTIRDILHRRPRAVEVFEGTVGGRFWGFLDRTVEDLGAEASLSPDLLLRRLEELPGPGEGTDWTVSPLYNVVDRLMENHRRYRGTDLPELEKLIASIREQDFQGGFPLDRLRADFHAFKIDILLHMEE